jgi:hypothetical protein
MIQTLTKTEYEVNDIDGLYGYDSDIIHRDDKKNKV